MTMAWFPPMLYEAPRPWSDDPPFERWPNRDDPPDLPAGLYLPTDLEALEELATPFERDRGRVGQPGVQHFTPASRGVMLEARARFRERWFLRERDLTEEDER